MTAAAALVGAAVQITRDPAREAARRELAKPEYHRDDPTLLQRVGQWILDRFADITEGANRVTPGGWVGVLVVLALLALVVVAVLVKVGGVRRRAHAPLEVLGGTVRTADEHRTAADAAAATGAYDVAVRERLRAIARELETRGVLDPRPGRTADELATDAGRALPAVAGLLRSAARAFDDIWYGGRRADAGHYAAVANADEAVRDARIVPERGPVLQ